MLKRIFSIKILKRVVSLAIRVKDNINEGLRQHPCAILQEDSPRAYDFRHKDHKTCPSLRVSGWQHRRFHAIFCKRSVPSIDINLGETGLFFGFLLFLMIAARGIVLLI